MLPNRSLLLILAAWLSNTAWGNPPKFNEDVLPILAENCFTCHGFDPASREADLRLDVAEGASDVIVAGDPAASELIARVESTDADSVMPPPQSGKTLSESQVEILRRWIESGAKFEKHWSFEPPERPDLPAGDAVHPIDRFVEARLRAVGLRASAAADPTTLIRRVSLDLIGLPPTPEEVDGFVAASQRDAEQAWASLVQRLLASPHYGERWGRWWLDQARYADSNGYSIDSPRSIWKYRDWVVEALNDDMPFDQFTIEQLAGDLLPNASVNQQVATGFHRNTQINQEGGIDREQYRIDSIFDRVATTGTVWLGLTIGCAQCHDHKFDPISQEEFYRLFAFLNNQDEPTIKVYNADVDVAAVTAARKAAEQSLQAWMEDQADALAAWETELDDEARKKLPRGAAKAAGVKSEKRNFTQRFDLFSASPMASDSTFQELREKYQQLSDTLNNAPTTMILRERGEPRKTAVLVKGDFTRPAKEVFPGTPSILHPLQSDRELPNRLDLGDWIVDPRNPLTARVIVNRVWQHYFGKGLVATENDFGLLGARPSHPELLDWLACEFVERRWSLKEMHRLIVSSETYRRSSAAVEESRLKDPGNLWLSRQERLRLDAEIVRDVALVASGLFAPRLGGPPVYPPIPDGVMTQGQVRRGWKASEGEDRYRRGLYTFVYRATPPPSLNVFDAPDGFSSCTRRSRSNTPLQSLTLMNDAACFEFAEALEKIIQRDGLETAFRRCVSREPSQSELAVLQRLETLTAARVLLNLDETITRE